MGVSYDAVVGFGTEYDSITFESLTELGKKKLIYNFTGHGHTLEKFIEIFYKVKSEFLDELGFTATTGSLMLGKIDMIGVPLHINSAGVIEEIAMGSAKHLFKKYINLKPEAFVGILQS